MFLNVFSSQFHIENCFIKDRGGRSGTQEIIFLSSDTKDSCLFLITKDANFLIWVFVFLTLSYKRC